MDKQIIKVKFLHPGTTIYLISEVMLADGKTESIADVRAVSGFGNYFYIINGKRYEIEPYGNGIKTKFEFPANDPLLKLETWN